MVHAWRQVVRSFYSCGIVRILFPNWVSVMRDLSRQKERERLRRSSQSSQAKSCLFFYFLQQVTYGILVVQQRPLLCPLLGLVLLD